MIAFLKSLPSYERALEELAEAELGIGWAAACEEGDQYVLVNRPLIEALAAVLRNAAPLSPVATVVDGHADTAEGGRASHVLEVGAGNGELADALRACGVGVFPTDADPPPGSSAIRLSAAEALRKYRPAVVIGSFVPFDAGVDEAVLHTPSVEHYITLNARLGGQYGSEELWRDDRWDAIEMPEISRWMVCRHDVWLNEGHVLRHGEVWRFSRASLGSTMSHDREGARMPYRSRPSFRCGGAWEGGAW